MTKKFTAIQRHKALLETINSIGIAINSLSSRVKALEERNVIERSPSYQEKVNINRMYGKFAQAIPRTYGRWIVNHMFQRNGIGNKNCTQCGNTEEEHAL